MPLKWEVGESDARESDQEQEHEEGAGGDADAGIPGSPGGGGGDWRRKEWKEVVVELAGRGRDGNVPRG
ncbi:hypothetical protein MLD38_012912 [Melastoma candidum]|uniref:Uncharacterized protein n=1 Tax=Melastoma candidum TaxID=119954 RepID=A0ACB9R7A7_9MYRT|nr:hypothetical protein MLD38_012912 [Melastoma candidum]